MESRSLHTEAAGATVVSLRTDAAVNNMPKATQVEERAFKRESV